MQTRLQGYEGHGRGRDKAKQEKRADWKVVSPCEVNPSSFLWKYQDVCVALVEFNGLTGNRTNHWVEWLFWSPAGPTPPKPPHPIPQYQCISSCSHGRANYEKNCIESCNRKKSSPFWSPLGSKGFQVHWAPNNPVNRELQPQEGVTSKKIVLTEVVQQKMTKMNDAESP